MNTTKILKEYQIKYSTKNLPIIDIALTEFMSAVFREFHKMKKLWGNSTNIIRISDEPMIYRILLYENDNPMYAVRFEQFMKKVLELGIESKCMEQFDSFLEISVVVEHV